MKPASLCEHCRQIKLEALLGPTPKDLEDVKTGSLAGPRVVRSEDGAEFPKVSLGSLGRMRTSMSACSLCALFVEIIEAQGAAYDDAAGRQSLDHKDVHFCADPDRSYCVRIVAQETSGQASFVLRRLNLTANHMRSPDTPIAYFDHTLQFCRPGEISEPPVDSMGTAASSPTFGGRRRPRKLDPGLVKKWINICQESHGTPCHSDTGPRMEKFRLIDVQKRCIREFHDVVIKDLRFIALSYVWGPKLYFRLQTNNFDQSILDGSLDTAGLPPTILDSMELARLIGFQFIWVDALCIIQDSIPDKVYQIQRMADIYLSAFMTIVAAAGDGPERGLPGVAESPRKGEQREVVVVPPSPENQGLSVVNCLKTYPSSYGEYYTNGQESIDISKWSHRAWTLQELALSHRSLIFTDEQVFWACHQGYFCEESHFEVPGFRVEHFNTSVHWLIPQGLGSPGRDTWNQYARLVNDYTRRDITYDGDVFNAFDAIRQMFERRIGTEFLWGLPCPLFELGLMWDTEHGVKRREALSTLPMTSLQKQVPFPTWSWMGWKGQVTCQVNSIRQESESSSVICYVYSASSQRFKHVTSSEPGSETKSAFWSDNEIKSNIPSLSGIQSHIPRLTPERLAQFPDSHILFFRTSSAHFATRYTQTKAPISIGDYGSIARPLILDPRDGNREVGRLSRTPADQGSAEPSMTEFIMVGQRSDPDIPPEIMPPMILVLQVERDEDGILRRLNFGEIEFGAWEAAKGPDCLVALG